MSFLIRNSLSDFNRAIETRTSIDADSNGNWHRVNWFMRVVYWMFSCLDDHRATRVANAFNSFLDQMELTPNAQKRDQSDQLNLIRQIADKILNVSFQNKSSKGIKTATKDLRHRVVALNYRNEAVNGGTDRKMPGKGFTSLRKVALAWKKTHDVMDDNDKLTPRDEEALKTLSQYSQFVDLITQSEELRNKTFKWIFRDHLDADVFVQFPNRVDRINTCKMPHRLGRYAAKMLKVEKVNNEKHVMMLINNKWESILDEHRKVDFGDGLVTTLKDMFEQFADKNHDWGQLEVLQHGVKKHLNVDIGQYIGDEGINDWWEQPNCLEHLCVRTLSLEEAQRRYGAHCDGVNWAGRVMATRQVKDLEVKGTHAYLEVAIPNANHEYRIFTFGKSSKVLPRSPWDYACTVAKTYEGCIVGPDPAIFNPLRQHWGLPFIVSPKEGNEVMDWIRHSIVQGRKKNMAYQLFTENCAKWVLEISDILGEHRVPKDIFKVHFHESKPPGFAGKVFSRTIKMSERFRNFFFASLFWIIGSTTGKTVIDKDGTRRKVSLSNLRPWEYPNNENFNIPAVLMSKQEKGELALSRGEP